MSCDNSSIQQQRYSTRILDNAALTTVMRTYDLALNELKKEEHYFPNGQKKFEGLFENRKLVEGSPVLWWYHNGQVQSRVLFNDNLQILSTDIWYETGQKQFSFFNENYTWWDENGEIVMTGNLNDDIIELPILSNTGKFIGIRSSQGIQSRMWIENWVLFNNINQPEYSGQIHCTLNSKYSVYREPFGQWTHSMTGKAVLIDEQLQSLLNERTSGFDFVLIHQVEHEELNTTRSINGNDLILNGKPSKRFKSRQFKRVHELILKSNGTFIHSWEKGQIDGKEVPASFSSGTFFHDTVKQTIALQYSNGLHEGEVHELLIKSHRELKYPFRGVTYLLR